MEQELHFAYWHLCSDKPWIMPPS